MNKKLMRLLAALVFYGLSTPMAQAIPIHTNYAVLFSGGYNAANNRPRYYDETLRMWDITTNILGFDPANVYVLFADGADPGLDQCDQEGGACSSYTNSDWSSVLAAGGNVSSALHDDLQNTLAFLSGKMTVNDSFYFWSFDHGDADISGVPNDVVLNGWDTELIRDDELAAWVDPFDVQAEIYAFGQCYSGGMVDDIMVLSGNNRSAAWACTGSESSYGQGWADAWADGLEAGLRWTNDLGQYALVNDPYGPYGIGLESPGWAGRNINIITNQIIPEPPITMLFVTGILVMIVRLQRAHRFLAADRAPATHMGHQGKRISWCDA
jgi:hypothetical protein